MFSQSDGEDSDDEWFYNSFKRYDDLLMYNVQGKISCMALKGNSKLLLASSRDHHHEISELSVPKKIIAGKDSGLTRDRDFSVLAAGYTKDLVNQMVPLEAGVVTSGSAGIDFYSIPNPHDETDIITHKLQVKKDAENCPVAATDSLVYYGKEMSDLVACDLISETSKKLSFLSGNLETARKDSHSKPISELCFKHGKLYICLMHSGKVVIYDPRENLVSEKCFSNEPLGGRWTLDVSNNGNYIATLSSDGYLRLQDNRNLCKFLYMRDFAVEEEFKSVSEECICVRLCPRSNFVSVSGISRNIEILDIHKELKDTPVFIHDGHREKTLRSISTHIWHQVQENLLFSADDTGQLQAWRFKGS